MAKEIEQAKGSSVFTGFVVRGVTALPVEDIRAALSPFVGANIDLRSLDRITQVVNSLYRERGWLARSTLPPQDLSEGRLLIQVVESTFSGVRIEDPQGLLQNTQVPKRVIETAQPVGEAVSLPALEEANAKLADLAGVKTRLNVVPGQEEGQTGAVLQVEQTKPIELTVGADNSGSRSTGPERAHVRATFNNPTQRGDSLVAQGLVTEGVQYAQVQYSLPFNQYGWRVGGQWSAMQYKLISDDFSSADMRGPTSNQGLFVVVPLQRRPSGNISFQMMFDNNRYRNEAAGQVVSRYQSQLFSMGLEGNAADGWMGGGENSWSAFWSRGELDLSDSPEAHRTSDASTTQTAGYFSKVRLSAMRRQVLDPANTLVVMAQGQWANRNLDGSEKFFLGGARGVRAYPTNEAGGALGGLASLEWQHRWNSEFQRWTLSGFYDHGRVRVNKENDFTGAASPNDYSLRGYGLWLGAQTDFGVAESSVRLTWARRLGENPGRSTLGLDQDGTRTLNRFRLDANLRF
jgi:hemolysin activation/secretion protein